MPNEYLAGTLAGRPIWWCPDAEGHRAYCPGPTDPDEYVYCCTYPYLDDDLPSCCRYPIHTGLVYCSIIAAFVFTCLCVFLTCWFLPGSPLNRRYRTVESDP